MTSKKKADQQIDQNTLTDPSGSTARIDSIKKFLRDLDHTTEKFTFSTWKDGEKGYALSEPLHGTIEEHFAELDHHNKQGCAIGVSVNATALQGARNNDNIRRIRAVFADTDGAPLEPIIEALEPHIVVNSSPGNWHVYFLVDDLPLEQFTPVQEAIAERFGTDRVVIDRGRMLRCVGFYHQKGEPFLVRCVEVAK